MALKNKPYIDTIFSIYKLKFWKKLLIFFEM